jgi:hypothetical protein
MRLSFLSAVLVVCAGLFAAAPSYGQNGPYQYYALTPCRAVDTRNATAVNGGPKLQTAAARSFQIQGSCGVPVGAKAVTLNVTIVNPTAPSYLTLWPAGTPQPFVSTINFGPPEASLANGAIVPLGTSTTTGDLSVYNCCGTVNLILDITGYFQ